MLAEKGVEPGGEAYRELLAVHGDAAFYHNKIQSAVRFCYRALPSVVTQAVAVWAAHAGPEARALVAAGAARRRALLIPELIEVLAVASYDDVMTAVDHSNESSRRSLAALFPEVVVEAVGRLSRRES